MGDNLVNVGVPSGNTVMEIVGGPVGEWVCLIMNDGESFCFGYNYYGQVGRGDGSGGAGDGTWIGDADGEIPPGNIVFGSGLKALDFALGAQDTCAVLSDASVRCWGKNYCGKSVGPVSAPTIDFDGAAVTFTRCGVDVYASSNVCVACAGGSTNKWVDNPSGRDTACGCATNEHIVSNTCTPCARFSSVDVGHPVPGPDTTCVYHTGLDALRVHLVADDLASNAYASWDDRASNLPFTPPAVDHCRSCSGNTHSLAPILVHDPFNGHSAIWFGFGDYSEGGITGLTGLLAPTGSETVFHTRGKPT